jgi:ribitol-5-phosphate 2-dehydrogenase
MIIKSFKIAAPKRFEVYMENLEVKPNELLVKIEKATICKADIRYYLGDRNRKILDLKYPMSLLHETVGTVLKNNSNKQIQVGEKVVLIPILVPNPSQGEGVPYWNASLGENYHPHAKFASSNCDGFSKEMVCIPDNNVQKTSKQLAEKEAVFMELISVALASIRRIGPLFGQKVAVWGDGVLGYILCCVLKKMNVQKVICVGKHREKLDKFPADANYYIKDPKLKEEDIDTAFECVGGHGSQSAIDQIIDTVSVGAAIVLTGVSEQPINVNTRRILEKGLSIFGSTRSTYEDFKVAAELLEDDIFKDQIAKLVLGHVDIHNINDFYDAFELEIANKELGKYILNFRL